MNASHLGTTNTEKPFEPGETIDYCDDHYVVISNHGNSGTVQEVGSTQQIYPFYWNFKDAECRRVISQPAAA